MKSLVLRLLLLGFAVIVAAGSVEVLLHLFKPEAVGLSHQPCIYVRDETNGYAYRPNSRDRMHRHFEMDTAVAINSDGFHDVERGALAAEGGTLRIAAVGDSFTASLHVPLSATWTQVLAGEMTARKGTPVDVCNLGLDGTGTDIQVNVLKAQLSRGLEFDRVILAFYKNDVDDVAMGPFFREVQGAYVITYQDENQRKAILEHLKNGQPPDWIARAYRHSYLFRLIFNAFDSDSLLRSNFVGPQQAGLKPVRQREPRARLDAAFQELLSLSDQNHFALWVVPVPTKKDPNGSLKALTDNVSQAVLHELSVVDVVPRLERLRSQHHLRYRDLFWKHDGHLNEAGNRLFALALAEALDEAGKQEQADLAFSPDLAISLLFQL